jgi:L-amino acid N-acyltransferase YncA
VIIRDARPEDAAGMAEILNRIIAIGGTTAHETPMTPDEIREGYISGPEVLSAVVAEDEGQILGWQSVEHWQGEAHIGTFVRPGIQARGVGVAMFARTRAQIDARGLKAIVASIRADNVPGLAYYARLGFADVSHEPDYALKDGTVVGRVHRRFHLV